MDFFRIFPWIQQSKSFEPGGPFFVPRDQQGQGRHDIPDLDAVLYCSREMVSAFGEFIQPFRGQLLPASVWIRPDGLRIALAHFRIADERRLVDLDNPAILEQLGIRPSQVLTKNRGVTRAMASKLFRTKASGLLWPSALESSWTNASLFLSRIRPSLSMIDPILPVTSHSPELREAAKTLGVRLQ